MIRTSTAFTVALCAGGFLVAGCGGKGTSPEAAMPTGERTGATSAVDTSGEPHYETMADMIRGQVPGLEVVDGSNGDFALRVRGASVGPSFTSNMPGDTANDGSALRLEPGNTYTEPLVIIDGMPVSAGNNARALKAIQPTMVESITVHKDVSSTSMYGNRGAHGVVVIRTKH